MKFTLATLAMALLLSISYNVEGYNPHPLVEQTCSDVPFAADCVASLSSKFSSKPDAEINQNEILGAAITVLKERAIRAREVYHDAHETCKDSHEQKVLYAAVGEYNRVVDACEKASGPAKAGVFAVAKAAVEEADLCVSHGMVSTENPNLKHVSLNLQIASKNAVAIANKALTNPGTQSQN